MPDPPNLGLKTYIVEHLDPELGPWSVLEYLVIAKESEENEALFCLSSVPKSLIIPQEIQVVKGTVVEGRSVEELYEKDKGRICLLDPAALEELSPLDGAKFDIFLFGGILGTRIVPARCHEPGDQLMMEL